MKSKLLKIKLAASVLCGVILASSLMVASVQAANVSNNQKLISVSQSVMPTVTILRVIQAPELFCTLIEVSLNTPNPENYNVSMKCSRWPDDIVPLSVETFRKDGITAFLGRIGNPTITADEVTFIVTPK